MRAHMQVAYYLVVNLDADSATVNTYSAISYLPWCLKIFMVHSLSSCMCTDYIERHLTFVCMLTGLLNIIRHMQYSAPTSSLHTTNPQGVLSDCAPINGKHREPYLLGGWAIFVGSNIVLWAQSTPGVASVLLWTFIMTMGCVYICVFMSVRSHAKG